MHRVYGSFNGECAAAAETDACRHHTQYGQTQWIIDPHTHTDTHVKTISMSCPMINSMQMPISAGFVWPFLFQQALFYHFIVFDKINCIELELITLFFLIFFVCIFSGIPVLRGQMAQIFHLHCIYVMFLRNLISLLHGCFVWLCDIVGAICAE